MQSAMASLTLHLYGRANDPPIFLPASQNFKTVHALCVASCLEANVRNIWGYPHLDQFGTNAYRTSVL